MKIRFIILLAFFSVSASYTNAQNTGSLDSLWNSLIFEKGGCLTGGQRVRDGKFGNEGCVLTSRRPNDWDKFFKYSKNELTPFLISKLADTSTTRIHTCPFFSSTSGELAVYCLQKIYLINWYDFPAFQHYQKREITGSDDNEQAWLQAILEHPKKREQLSNYWIQQLKKNE